MKQKVIPGYKALFGEPSQTYEQVLAEMPSLNIISIAAIINNELNAPLDYKINQYRILSLLKRGFTIQQNNLLDFHLKRLEHAGYGEDATELFHRRYLAAIILKELKRNATSPKYIPANGKDFKFLLAYLMIIDEENATGRIALDKSLGEQEKPFKEYNLLWTPIISQYQFNESVSPAFELFKLFCLLQYAKKHWKPYIKSFLSEFNFDTIGKITGSYNQIFIASNQYNPQISFSKFADINPNSGVDVKHLQSLCINQQMGNQKSNLLSIKKQPLLNVDNKYRIIDANFFYKHIYKGPFFDLYKTTTLKEQIKFNEYSSRISKDVLETVCFVSVLKTLDDNNGKLYFDDGTDSIPDGYYRHNYTIFLFEFKAYILNDNLAEKPDFENLKSYLDENFVEKEDGKPKGIGQLLKQIENLAQGSYTFDDDLIIDGSACYTIYPIICHNDFNFSLPGINEYINTKFKNQLELTISTVFDIKNVTFINLDWLFDLSLRNGNFITLSNYIDRYWSILDEKKKLFNERFNSDVFLNSKSSFDEIYQHSFIHELPSVQEGENNFNSLLINAGINQEMVDEIIL